MFWKYNMSTSSRIDTLLTSEGVTLKVIMDEDDIIQECKAKNPKLIEFLVRPEILEELVTYITTEPPEDLEDSIRFKYPNIACELLTSDIVVLNEKLASDEILLEKLYSFLHTDKKLNPLLASYFSRTLEILVVMRGEINWFSCQYTCLQVLEFFKSKEDFLLLLLKHLGTSVIKDLLYRLMTSIDGPEVRSSVLNWLSEQKLVCRLVNLINSSIDEDRHSNASDILCNLIAFCRDKMTTPQEHSLYPSPLLMTIESPEVITELLNQMFTGEKQESVLVSGMSVLLSLLETRKPDPLENVVFHDQSDKIYDDVRDKFLSSLAAIVTTILPRLGDFKELLICPPEKSSFMTTVGNQNPPLGMTRLRVAQLVVSLLGTGNLAAGLAIIEQDLMSHLFYLIKEYEWNNFFHTEVYKCLLLILTWQPDYKIHDNGDGNGDAPTGSSNSMLQYIFQDFNIIHMLVDLWQESKNREESIGRRKGYMGHVIEMIQSILNHSVNGVNCDFISNFLKNELDEELNSDWQSICHQIEDILKLTYSVSGDDALTTREPAQYSIDISLQQSFNEFHIQQVSKDFIDGIDFKDKEFSEPEEKTLWKPFSTPFIVQEDSSQLGELFEQTCKDRDIYSGDIEDMWEDKNLTYDLASSSRMRKDSLENYSSEDDDNPAEQVEEDSLWSHKPSGGVQLLNNWADFTNFGAAPKEIPKDDNWADFSKIATHSSGENKDLPLVQNNCVPENSPPLEEPLEDSMSETLETKAGDVDCSTKDSSFLSSSGLIKQEVTELLENGPISNLETDEVDNTCDSSKTMSNAVESTLQNGPI